MATSARIARAIITTASAGLIGAALAAASAPAASAAPGDWTQVSQTSSATTYPQIANIDEPTAAWFGGTLQVVWRQQSSAAREGYSTALLDSAGRLATGPVAVFGDWTTLTSNPTLLSLGGQRFLTFSGLNPDRGGAQYFATSADGLTWSVSPGSMSQTQVAYAAYGSDAVDNAGTVVWVGNPGTTTGITWHVGTSPSNPAPAGSDQSYALTGCCAYDAAAARDGATGAVYAAFYSNSGATTENGIQVGQILPTSSGWRQAPGSTQIQDGRASSSDPGQRVAMVGRPGGGVFIAYAMGYPTARTIRILNVTTNATLDVPRTADARSIALTAEPDGRLWLTWRQGETVFAVHTDPAVTELGSIGRWGAPRGTEDLWKSTAVGTTGGAALVYTATAQNAINVWSTNVVRTLTVTASPRSVRRGEPVTVTVTDAGDPVAGATVRIGSRTGTTNAAGRVTLDAPASTGRARITATEAGYNRGVTSVRVR